MQTTYTVSGPQFCYLVSINTTTGVLTTIGNEPTFGIGGGSSAIDRINQGYIYVYSTGGSTFYIATLDIATGNVISNKLLPLGSGDNIHSIAFDNIRGKLYGIQWDADGTCGYCTISISQNSNLNTQIPIYPNPASIMLTVEGLMLNENSRIEIKDVLGNAITIMPVTLSLSKGNTQDNTIDVSQLNEGIYNLSISTTEGIINKRVVISR